VSEVPVIAVLGPTAVGKSRIAIGLAQRFNGEIICADSRQIYRRLDVGTDKIPIEAQGGIPHHLQDSVDPEETVSAGSFVRMADQALVQIRSRGRVPFLVGGSGLYTEAFLSGLFSGPSRSERIRRRLAESREKRGEQWLHRMLSRFDPQAARELSPRDRQRVIRALEVRLLTGRKFSWHLEQDRALRKENSTRFAQLRLGLTLDRKLLNQRIEERVDQMIDKGLVQEVKQLLASGLDQGSNALNAIGYAEVIQDLDGRLDGGLEEVRELIKRNTRRLAKRQITWFRNHGDVKWFSRTSDEETIKKIEDHLLTLLE